MRTAVVIWVLTLAGCGTLAGSSSLEDVAARAEGRRVWLTKCSGGRLEGEDLRITPDSVALRIGADRQMWPRSDVRTVALRTGPRVTPVGVGLGLAAGVLTVGALSPRAICTYGTGFGGCTTTHPGVGTSGQRLLAGALVGIGIVVALRGRQPLGPPYRGACGVP